MHFEIKNLFIGKSKEYKLSNRVLNSAYEKEIQNEIYVSKLGVKNDEQVDKKNHGGVDRAVCIYSQGSYDFLEEKFNINLKECSFGENITLENCSDSDICIGDIFSCGETLLEVSQPRIPCFVISKVTGIKDLTRTLVQECKIGFLLRTIKEGKISKSDSFNLEKRANKNYSIEFISKCYLNPVKYEKEVLELLKVDSLAQDYKDSLKSRLGRKTVGIEEFQKDII
ncbi:MAG: MOSC domain-containing protein [Halarcobacter ebronensis]|uniref:MOSC domain-containing protein n=1 Tax=Halarcobacter ebronensis TaxID=1462615 RepID=UPI003C72191A